MDDHPPGAGGIAVDPTNELVVDRAGHPGMIFRHHSVPEQRHRRPGRQLAIELDGKSVHRDRADDPPRLALDPDFGSGQVTAKAVRVTDRNDPDPGWPLGHEASPVAGALAGCELSNLREPARPAERGLETVVPGGGAEGRETVDRNPATGGLEASVGKAESPGAVGEMARQMPVRLGRLSEALDLRLGELGIAVGAGEVAHQPDDPGSRLRQLREAPAAHARVELEVGPDALGNLTVRADELEPGLAYRSDLPADRCRPHDEDSGGGELLAQLEAFGDRRDAEHARPCPKCRAGDVEGAMSVAVRLDDCPELGAVEHVEQPPDIAADRAEIDRQLRPLHRGRPVAARSRRLQPARDDVVQQAPRRSEPAPPWRRRAVPPSPSTGRLR